MIRENHGENSCRKVYSRVLKGATLNEIAHIGNFESLSRTLRNYKNNRINPKPYLFLEVGLSHVLAKT